MSRTTAIGFRGRRLWAHTEGLQVLLALMVEGADRCDARDDLWLSEVVQSWRVQASVADLGFALDDNWSPEQVSTVRQLVEESRAGLRRPDAIDRLLRPGWSVLDGIPVADGVGAIRPVERVDEVAAAVVLLLDERLPPDPPDAWWFVGTADVDWRHIVMRRR